MLMDGGFVYVVNYVICLSRLVEVAGMLGDEYVRDLLLTSLIDRYLGKQVGSSP